ncbi:ABC transporter permease [Ferruginibacter lapsinanis]|uniref:ABC transporter permease n=1 Tax=Ferruginibacter lapsinanis TaxID=563172 RepID=UPI001E30DAFF|nr:ABC transporter permease subunit [Ferruginibacter lapsinanis]UEG51082.1 ABC transporter permease [Ferruginibacter lapsinanis]
MWKLLQIELYKITKRPRTYIAFIAIAAIVFIFQFAFKADGQTYMDLMLQSVKDSFEMDKVKAINGYFMCYIILNTLLIQVPILVALIAADSISGEANMGTLRLLISKPISRTQLILVKFAAATIFTVLLLLWMAITALFFSLLIFGADDMLIFRVKGDESQILQILKDDIMWRYFAAFAYATVALTVIAALSLFLSIFAENSIGPIIATVCIVIVCTIISNINVPIIDRNVKPYLFTSYLVGWKGFFYIGTTDDGEPIKGSIENWPAIRNSLLILIGHIIALVSLSVIVFRKKDILS